MDGTLFGSDLWAPALDKYAEATGLSVELFAADGKMVLASTHATPLFGLFRQYGFDPGLFAECARRCLKQTLARPAVFVDEQHGLTVVGASLVLEEAIVGAAVAGYALAGFSQVAAVQRWASSAGVPFERLWDIVRRQPPVPERRLVLHGELLQVLGDALLRENFHTRQLQSVNAAKDEFLAVLSHELRTPLAAISGWASVMKKAENLAHARRAAEVIEHNAFLQSRMVDELLDLNRITRGSIELDLEILELHAVIRGAVEAMAEDIERKPLQLEFDALGDALFVEGDAARLQQVFRNIISNAVKFTPSGGRLRVTIRQEGRDALVAIADTGRGISAAFLPFVFEMFRQQEQGTRREHSGLGIGMAVVKRLTELHNGTVSVSSAGAERGTELTVRLPLSAEIPELYGDAPPATWSTALPLDGVAILLVEDEPDARESLQLVLQSLGARVSAAGDGCEALDTIRQGRPDIVLCDLRMPRMDGFEFMRELPRAASPEPPPVVAVSALATEADRRRVREAGFEGHLRKPFAVPALVTAIEAALGRDTAAVPGASPSD